MACDITYYRSSVAKLAYFRMIRDAQRHKVQRLAAHSEPLQAVSLPLQATNRTNDNQRLSNVHESNLRQRYLKNR
jgi:hypothetical protein